MFKYRALPSLCTERFRISTGVKQQLSTVSDGRGKIVARKSKMRLSFVIGIIVLNLTNCHVESQEQSTESLNDVSTEKISVGSEQTLGRLKKMTNEQKLNALTELTYSANNFFFNFCQNDTHINDVLPGFALYQSMGLLARISTAETKHEIRKILNLPNNKLRIFAGFEEIHRRFNKTNSPWYPSNKLILDQNAPMMLDLETISERIYSVQIERTLVPTEVNKVVSQSKITCSVKSQKEVSLSTFTNVDGTPTADTGFMKLTGKYRYGLLPEIKATFVEIPCQYDSPRTGEPNDGSTRMFILLPDNVNGLDNLSKNIGTLSINKLSTADLHDVIITLPVVSKNTDSSIIDTLKKMGLTRMFSENEIFEVAPQSNINSFDYIGSFEIIKHDDSITSPGPTIDTIPKVTVDRPFIAIITTTDETPLILEMARVTSIP